MTLRLGEVVLIRMQFLQAAGSKIRPALTLLDDGDDDFVAAPIITVGGPVPSLLPEAGWKE